MENGMCDNGRVCAAKYLGKCRQLKPLKTEPHITKWTTDNGQRTMDNGHGNNDSDGRRRFQEQFGENSS